VRRGEAAVGDDGEERVRGLSWPAGPGAAQGGKEEWGAGEAWPGWAISAAGSAQSGRPLFSFILFFYLFLLFEYAFEAPKIFGKMQIRYRWKPCENTFILEPFLKQNKILLKPKLPYMPKWLFVPFRVRGFEITLNFS
jgi:hypothetical protein